MATYTGTAGNETLTGSAGDDVVWTAGGSDVVYAGAGNDSIDDQAGVQLGGTDTVYAGAGADTVWAGAGNDRIYGGDGTDLVVGEDGNDSVFGGAGSDLVFGGAGVDVLAGDYGVDTLWGDAGVDSLYGLSGNDVLYGGTEGDTLSGGTGADTLYGGDAGDVMRGDVIVANSGDLHATGSLTDTTLTLVNQSPNAVHAYWLNSTGSSVYGGTVAAGGSATFTTGSGVNWFLVDGATGEIVEVIFGAPAQSFTYTDTNGADVLFGDAGADTIWGDAGTDTLSGGDAGDTLYGGLGADSLGGDAGDDSLYGGDAADSLAGGDDADRLWGDAGDDTLAGGPGADTAYGGAGNDTVSVGAGDGLDLIDGGEAAGDRDLLDFGDGAAGQGVRVTLTGTDGGTYAHDGGATGTFAGIEAVSGTAGADLLDASASAGPQTLLGEGGADSLLGGAGADSLAGGAGADALAGGGGADSLAGDDGDDSLAGGGGDDSLAGGLGADRLAGGAGSDRIATGAGADTVALDLAGGADRVTDFDLSDPDGDGRATDQLDVSALRDAQGNPVDAWDVTVTSDGAGNALLAFPGGETLVLEGIAPAQVTGAQALWRLGIPCFTAGTPVDTPRGPVPVERLRPGDRVLTRDDGPRPVRWVAMRRLGPAELAADPRLRPVRAAPGALGNAQALLVSPQHGLLLRDGGGERLVRAAQLARMRGGAVRVARGVRRVTYVHLMLDAHALLRADGVWSESFYPGPAALDAAGAAARAELLRLFPDLAGGPAAYGPPARPYARTRELPRRLDALRPPAP